MLANSSGRLQKVELHVDENQCLRVNVPPNVMNDSRMQLHTVFIRSCVEFVYLSSNTQHQRTNSRSILCCRAKPRTVSFGSTGKLRSFTAQLELEEVTAWMAQISYKYFVDDPWHYVAVSAPPSPGPPCYVRIYLCHGAGLGHLPAGNEISWWGVCHKEERFPSPCHKKDAWGRLHPGSHASSWIATRQHLGEPRAWRVCCVLALADDRCHAGTGSCRARSTHTRFSNVL